MRRVPEDANREPATPESDIPAGVKYLVLIRHGESEGNKAAKAARAGDLRFFSILHEAGRKGWEWRLTLEGVRQAAAAADLLLREYPEVMPFTRICCSTYIRAGETAGIIADEIGEHRPFYLSVDWGERGWGNIDALAPEDRMSVEEEIKGLLKHDFLGTAPPGGESVLAAMGRFKAFMGTISRECPGGNVLLVSHGEFMWAARTLLERLLPEQLAKYRKHKRWGINNCQVIVYSRVNPETGELAPRFEWMSYACPWDPSRSPSGPKWRRIVRPRLTGNQLLERARLHPRLIE